MSDKTIKAKRVKPLSEGFSGNVWLWELSEPVKYEFMTDDREIATAETRYIITSATTVAFSGVETYIFPTDETGKVLSWLEMDGSRKGHLDHKKAIRYAGWEIDE